MNEVNDKWFIIKYIALSARKISGESGLTALSARKISEESELNALRERKISGEGDRYRDGLVGERRLIKGLRHFER